MLKDLNGRESVFLSRKALEIKSGTHRGLIWRGWMREEGVGAEQDRGHEQHNSRPGVRAPFGLG